MFYVLAGTINGLTANGLVLANGTDNETVNVPANATLFIFPTPLQAATPYGVTVQTQPAGQYCQVSNGTGSLGTANLAVIAVGCVSGQWAWRSGADTRDAPGVYGSQGVAASTNVPGARVWPAAWTDVSGNLWLFGGCDTASLCSYAPNGDLSQINGQLNDLWRYSPSTGQWTWVSGSSAPIAAGVYGTQGAGVAGNTPGAREYPLAWTDPSGNFWLFGGNGFDSANNRGLLYDLWKYSPSTDQWTWMGGPQTLGGGGVYGTQGVPAATNLPGATDAATWTDASGNLWLFGGFGSSATGPGGDLNDLWEFSPSTGEWTWVNGSSTADVSGIYGTQGAAAPTNVPGSRLPGASWTDASGNLWLFGGTGCDATEIALCISPLNDLWKYTPTTGLWTWMSGSSTEGATGVYGTLGVPAPTNVPGARTPGNYWSDASGNLWLFGGAGLDSMGNNGPLSDLWKYTVSTGEWTWMGGRPTTPTICCDSGDVDGVYGMLNVPAATNLPGARQFGVSWTDASGHLWLFGGQSWDAGGGNGPINDLWEYLP